MCTTTDAVYDRSRSTGNARGTHHGSESTKMDATASMAACLIASSPSSDAVLSSSSLVVVVVDVDELLLTNKRRAGPTVPTNNPDGSSLCTSYIAPSLTSRVRMPMATSCAHRLGVASPGIVGVCVCVCYRRRVWACWLGHERTQKSRFCRPGERRGSMLVLNGWKCRCVRVCGAHQCPRVSGAVSVLGRCV